MTVYVLVATSARSVYRIVSNRRFSLTSVLLSRIVQSRTWRTYDSISGRYSPRDTAEPQGTVECISLKCNAPAICLLTHWNGSPSQVTRGNERRLFAKRQNVCSSVSLPCCQVTNKSIYPLHLVGHIGERVIRLSL